MAKTKARKLRQFEPLKAFDKDWEKLAHSGRYELTRLKVVMALLLDPDVALPPEYLDHSLQGGWDGHRECHIGGDWLLIYRLADVGSKTERVIFCRTGTHSELFGQFVDHVGLIRAYLDSRSVRYQYLDGATPMQERKQRVDAFQAGEGDVFLISLKAGGTGLNLTAADYVIHMDPWMESRP